MENTKGLKYTVADLRWKFGKLLVPIKQMAIREYVTAILHCRKRMLSSIEEIEKLKKLVEEKEESLLHWQQRESILLEGLGVYHNITFQAMPTDDKLKEISTESLK